KDAAKMSLVKRGKTWHTHFFVDGQRFRQSLDTSDWREAQAREKELITQASRGKLAPVSQQFGRLAFGEAANRFLEGRRLDLSQSSQKKERQLLVQPRRFFGAPNPPENPPRESCWLPRMARESGRRSSHYQHGNGRDSPNNEESEAMAS